MLHIAKNEQVAAVEDAFAAANGAERAYAFASAPMAVSALVDLLDSGCHVLASEGLHPDIYRIMGSIRARSAADRFEFVDLSDPAVLEAAVSEATRLLWIEALAGPRLSQADLRAVTAFAKQREIVVAVDNSALTHAVSKPLEEGCDIVFSSLSCGGGLVAFSASVPFVEERFAFIQRAYDCPPVAEQAGEMLAELKECAASVVRRAAIAAAVGEHLDGSGFILGLEQPAVACSELAITFSGSADEVAERLARLRLFASGRGPGDIGTYWHFANRTYASVPPEIRRALGIEDGTVRFSMPDLDPGELAGDLLQAFV